MNTHTQKKCAISLQGKKNNNSLAFQSGKTHTVIRGKDAEKVTRMRTGKGQQVEQRNKKRDKQMALFTDRNTEIKTAGERVPCH